MRQCPWTWEVNSSWSLTRQIEHLSSTKGMMRKNIGARTSNVHERKYLPGQDGTDRMRRRWLDSDLSERCDRGRACPWRPHHEAFRTSRLYDVHGPGAEAWHHFDLQRPGPTMATYLSSSHNQWNGLPSSSSEFRSAAIWRTIQQQLLAIKCTKIWSFISLIRMSTNHPLPSLLVFIRLHQSHQDL